MAYGGKIKNQKKKKSKSKSKSKKLIYYHRRKSVPLQGFDFCCSAAAAAVNDVIFDWMVEIHGSSIHRFAFA